MVKIITTISVFLLGMLAHAEPNENVALKVPSKVTATKKAVATVSEINTANPFAVN